MAGALDERSGIGIDGMDLRRWQDRQDRRPAAVKVAAAELDVGHQRAPAGRWR